MAHESYRRMLSGEISSRQYAAELKREVGIKRAARRPYRQMPAAPLAYLRSARKHRRETIALTCIFFGSLTGIALCWWLG